MKSRFRALGLFFAFTSGLAAAPEPTRVERLASVAKLWGTIKFTHPWLAYKPIDWDAALVKSIPKINAAESREEYATAVDALLDELHDPVTHVIRETQPRQQRGGIQEQPSAKMLDGGVLLISLNRIGMGEWNGVLQRMQTAAARIADAKAVVVDLRADSQQSDRVQGLINDMVDHTELARRLVTKPLIAAGWRGRMNSGYASAARPLAITSPDSISETVRS
jgi:hypothetical protein